MDEAARAVDLLQERRTALISAAVIGKIDVRGVVSGDNVSDVRAARGARAGVPA